MKTRICLCCLYGCFFVCGVALPLRANHIIGGFLALQVVNAVEGSYKLRLEVVMDGNSASLPAALEQQRVLVYERSGRSSVPERFVYVSQFALDEVSREPVRYKNPACQSFYRLNAIRIVYEKDITLRASDYTAQAGYYIIWGKCCRQSNLLNIDNADSTPSAYRVEFNPALNGPGTLINSTPSFKLDRTDIICLQEPFSLAVAGADPDGDELHYSLVTPLQVDVFYDVLYESFARWTPGFSAANSIPGDPPLRIDPKTGVIRVKANQTGFFAFAIRCEEYRNGQRIGSSITDTFIGVYDCNTLQRPPRPVLAASSSTSPCGYDNVTLTVADGPYWYEWKQNGIDLPDQTRPTLTVNQSGTYTATVYSQSACTAPSTSGPLAVTLTKEGNASPTITSTGYTTFCAGQTVELIANVPAGLPGNWFWTSDGQKTGVDKQTRLRVSRSGTYSLGGDWQSDSCIQEPVASTVVVHALPTVSIVPSSSSFCQGDTATLAVRTDAANSLTWTRNGLVVGTTPSLTATAAASYTVVATTPAGCSQVATYLYSPQINLLPVFKLTPSGHQYGSSLTSDAPENSAYRYRWSPPEGVSNPAIARPLFTPTGPTLYTLVITDKAGCQYADTLRYEGWPRLYVPSAFTPNGDGDNDVWQPINTEKFPDAEVYIVNRWGTVIYVGRAGQYSFDGRLGGEPLPAGTYTYRIRLNAGDREQVGTLQLLR